MPPAAELALDAVAVGDGGLEREEGVRCVGGQTWSHWWAMSYNSNRRDTCAPKLRAILRAAPSPPEPAGGPAIHRPMDLDRLERAHILTAWLNQAVQPGGQKGLRAPRPDQETRERILDAAHTVFLRKGTASSRTQEIAAEAGVNKALVHYYFGTKAALADAIFERALGTLDAADLRDPGRPRSHDRGEGARHRRGADRLPLDPALLRRLLRLRAARASRDRIARLMSAGAGTDPARRASAGSSARRARAGTIRRDQRRAVRRQHDGPADLSVRHPAGALQAPVARRHPLARLHRGAPAPPSRLLHGRARP